jgi:heptosyltransferase-1
MKRILLVKTSSLGDVIHCLPVINDIRSYYPDIQIDWVVEDSFADIPRMHPHVNQVVPVAIRRWKNSLFSLKTWSEISAFKKNIKQHKYDAVIDCQGLLKSALIAKQALTTVQGLKHGYDKHSIREPFASQFYEITHAISYQQHAVTRNRTLCAMSLGYKIPTHAPDYGISATNNHLELPQQFVIGLHGTSRDSKLWPTEQWVSLGKELALKDFSLVLPWASDVEHARAISINNQLLNCSILPKMSIAQVATVIAKAKVAIGVDTGLSHLAAALNVPTIAIYTDTNPALTGVMAGAFKPVINLGGIHQTPTVEEVLTALDSSI